MIVPAVRPSYSRVLVPTALAPLRITGAVAIIAVALAVMVSHAPTSITCVRRPGRLLLDDYPASATAGLGGAIPGPDIAALPETARCDG